MVSMLPAATWRLIGNTKHRVINGGHHSRSNSGKERPFALHRWTVRPRPDGRRSRFVIRQTPGQFTSTSSRTHRAICRTRSDGNRVAASLCFHPGPFGNTQFLATASSTLLLCIFIFHNPIHIGLRWLLINVAGLLLTNYSGTSLLIVGKLVRTILCYVAHVRLCIVLVLVVDILVRPFVVLNFIVQISIGEGSCPGRRWRVDFSLCGGFFSLGSHDLLVALASRFALARFPAASAGMLIFVGQIAFIGFIVFGSFICFNRISAHFISFTMITNVIAASLVRFIQRNRRFPRTFGTAR
mmetsp:Transcript_21771/g.62430  ORF Transcript_21771/g.62430 Transcript_21771/m.62430 type:complete len:298 (+) Transcript_21771:498-1391(+)